MKFCLYGNPTIDVIVVKNTTRISHGGGVYYSALPLIQRGFNVEVYSALSPRLVDHPIARYIIKLQYSTRTNVFMLEYTNSERAVKVLEKAPPLYSWNTHRDLCYVVVNPVIGEVEISLLKLLRAKSRVLAVDIQGFVRTISTSGDVFLEPSGSVLDVLELADVVHADVNEAECLVKALGYHTTLSTSLSLLAKRVRGVLIITRGSNKITVIHSGVVKDIECENSYVALEKTGAGDYFLTVYLLNYLASGDAVDSVYKAHEEVTEWLKVRDKMLHHTPYYSTGEL